MGDGTAVGSMLVDGASDGSEVGLLDGSLDGRKLVEGRSVGSADGICDGSLLGNNDGRAVVGWSVGASVGANVGAVVLDAMIFSLSKFANPSSFVQFSSTGSAAAYAAYEHKLTAARRRTGKRAIGDGGRERRARRDGARWARSSRRR